MIADIYEFGPLKVILVVTDTCTTMKKEHCNGRVPLDDGAALPSPRPLAADEGHWKDQRGVLCRLTVNRASLLTVGRRREAV